MSKSLLAKALLAGMTGQFRLADDPAPPALTDEQREVLVALSKRTHRLDDAARAALTPKET